MTQFQTTMNVKKGKIIRIWNESGQMENFSKKAEWRQHANNKGSLIIGLK
jgi:hypothetical protein